MPTFRTPNRHGYAVKFSPLSADRILVATSQYYGLAGGGTLFLLQLTADGQLLEVTSTQWSDGLFDAVWSETDDHIAVTGSGDGSLQLWNVTSPQLPLRVFREHKKEVYSVDWSKTRPDRLILSASWDHSIKLWDPNCSTSLSTFFGHTQLVYSAVWSPHIPFCFASVSGDGMLKIWNSSLPSKASMTVHAHSAEVLTCCWNRYDHNVLATGGSDGLIRGWDLRYSAMPIFEQVGCQYAVRKVLFSPHCPSTMASVSYDFTTRMWDYKNSCQAVEVITHHTEFVYGLDFNIHVKGQIADCGWDSLVHVFTPKCLQASLKAFE